MENLRIGVVGNIGVGKSTLIDAMRTPPLSNILLSHFPDSTGDEKIHSFEEKFNPNVLAAFYEQPDKHALIAQIEFFNGRLERQFEIDRANGIAIEDRTIAEDYHIFGKAQKIMGHMSDIEFEVYQRNYNLMMSKIDQPTLIVYLRANVETLLARIANRGRDCEKAISKSYLEQLNQLYETFISRHTDCPVLVIDANEKKDLSTYLTETIQKVSNKIKELDLRVTTPGLKSWVTMPETAAALRAVDAERQLEDYLKTNKKLITVAGNVGLGKSTVTTLMHRSLRVKALYENPEENPLLEKFLKNKSKYCYQLQLHFLKLRAQQRNIGKNKEASYVKDRSLAEDLLVFSQHFYDAGHLTANEFDMLNTEFQKTNKTLPSADLMIVLQGRPELAWKRIQQRGREMEMQGGWTFAEIQSLNRYYKTYSDDARKFGYHDNPTLDINVNKLDLSNRVHMGYLFETIYNALNNA